MCGVSSEQQQPGHPPLLLLPPFLCGVAHSPSVAILDLSQQSISPSSLRINPDYQEAEVVVVKLMRKYNINQVRTRYLS